MVLLTIVTTTCLHKIHIQGTQIEETISYSNSGSYSWVHLKQSGLRIQIFWSSVGLNVSFQYTILSTITGHQIARSPSHIMASTKQRPRSC